MERATHEKGVLCAWIKLGSITKPKILPTALLPKAKVRLRGYTAPLSMTLIQIAFHLERHRRELGNIAKTPLAIDREQNNVIKQNPPKTFLQKFLEGECEGEPFLKKVPPRYLVLF